MVTSSELAYMRSSITPLLPDTCNIIAPTNSLDGQGNVKPAWGTIAGGTAVPCRLDAYKGTETERGAAIQSDNGYILTLPYTVVPLTSYRVEHGGYTYSITAVDLDKSWAVTRRVVVERL
jgi:hypothetical protein